MCIKSKIITDAEINYKKSLEDSDMQSDEGSLSSPVDATQMKQIIDVIWR